MSKTYCGACRGERGCIDCKAVGKSVVYTGLTEFFAEDMLPEVSEEDTAVSSECKESLRYHELLLAADLGTTTLAFVCADERGKVLASYGCENPQRKVAADVIGRIDAALHGQKESLTNEIREALVKGFLFVLKQGMKVLHTEDVKVDCLPIRIAIAGNTTMQHLLLGYPLDGMAKTPFLPYTTEEKTFSFFEIFGQVEEYSVLPPTLQQAKVTIFPCLSAFVGGDVVAGANVLFANNPNRTALLIDLGTNGEMLLSIKGKWYGTAAAMGSAFEGGRYAYAADLFRLMAKALRDGAIDETGLLCEPYFTEGFLGLQQDDVREFQLAKGAIRAGIELLCSYTKTDLSEIEHVFLAGGVGKYCECADLFRTGLLPKQFAGKVEIVGNSCIGGLLSCLKNRESMIYCKGEILNLAEQPEFESLYYQSMDFRREE